MGAMLTMADNLEKQNATLRKNEEALISEK